MTLVTSLVPSPRSCETQSLTGNIYCPGSLSDSSQLVRYTITRRSITIRGYSAIQLSSQQELTDSSATVTQPASIILLSGCQQNYLFSNQIFRGVTPLPVVLLARVDRVALAVEDVLAVDKDVPGPAVGLVEDAVPDGHVGVCADS